MSTLFQTGINPEGKPLVGGLWRMAHEMGFPLEIAYLECQQHGWAPNWREAMEDASKDNNLPALMRQLETFLDEPTITRLKISYLALVGNSGLSSSSSSF
jgi:hypothetical protein